MQSEDENVGAAAVQYLFFLWSHPALRDDARRITGRAVDALNLTRLAAYGALRTISSRMGGAASRQWRLFRNLAMVFLLVLAEGDEETVRLAIQPAVTMLRQLPLRLVGLLGTGLGHWGIDVAAHNVNPVGKDALDELLADPELLAHAEAVLDLCDAGARMDAFGVPKLLALAAQPNSLISTILSFALSCHYERAPEPRRAAALRVVAELFDHPDATAHVHYAASLAAYHINVFGGHPTEDSLAVLGTMAGVILERHKGVFRFHPQGRTENFNIIGTYGRALARHDALHPNRGRSPLSFAIDALEAAKGASRAPGDSVYYRYVCENVGLLGILTEPQRVLDVMASVLIDVGLVQAESEGRRLPFERHVTERLQQTALQSLANIRVLYGHEVDRYLLDVLEAPALQARVARTTPRLKLNVFHSWSFERMMFRLLTLHWDALGSTLVAAMREGLGQATARDCCKVFARRMLDRVVHLIAAT